MNLVISTLGTLHLKAGESASIGMLSGYIEQDNYMSVMPYSQTNSKYNLTIESVGRFYDSSRNLYQGRCTIKNDSSKDTDVMFKLLVDAPGGAKADDRAEIVKL